jgi:endoglucanase
MHNYGAYYLAQGSRGVRTSVGSTGCPIADFADAWRRISAAFKGDPGVIGYGLMNEPVGLQAEGGRSPQQVWERASQAAVDAIRAGGDGKVILVAGYEWSGVQQWDRWNPGPWIRDPAGRVRYEAHHYWDPDHSGTYAEGYDAAAADAAAHGF